MIAIRRTYFSLDDLMANVRNNIGLKWALV